MPPKNSTPEIEIQRSPLSVSSGSVRLRRLAGGGHRHLLGERIPRGDRLDGERPEHGLRRETGDRLGHRVPEADHAGAVEQEDAVADVRQHAGRLGARLDLVV